MTRYVALLRGINLGRRMRMDMRALRDLLGNAFWERKLGLTATTRNWNTTRRLAELASR